MKSAWPVSWLPQAQRHTAALGERVANEQPDQRHFHRMGGGADVVAAVGHVAVVVGAVEVLAVPAVGGS